MLELTSDIALTPQAAAPYALPFQLRSGAVVWRGGERAARARRRWLGCAAAGAWGLPAGLGEAGPATNRRRTPRVPAPLQTATACGGWTWAGCRSWCWATPAPP